MTLLKIFKIINQDSINEFLKGKELIGHGTIRTKDRDDILYIYYRNKREERGIHINFPLNLINSQEIKRLCESKHD